jgi:hypothetical protein
MLSYIDGIVLLAKHLVDLEKELGILQELCNRSTLMVNVDKTKIMSIKSKKSTKFEISFDNQPL